VTPSANGRASFTMARKIQISGDSVGEWSGLVHDGAKTGEELTARPTKMGKEPVFHVEVDQSEEIKIVDAR
jgi:hypothetical protein